MKPCLITYLVFQLSSFCRAEVRYVHNCVCVVDCSRFVSRAEMRSFKLGTMSSLTTTFMWKAVQTVLRAISGDTSLIPLSWEENAEVFR